MSENKQKLNTEYDIATYRGLKTINIPTRTGDPLTDAVWLAADLRDELEAERNGHAWLAGLVPDTEPFLEKLTNIAEAHLEEHEEDLDVSVFLAPEFDLFRRSYNRNALIASLTHGPVGPTGPMGMDGVCSAHGEGTVVRPTNFGGTNG